jgi:hypothetical protein
MSESTQLQPATPESTPQPQRRYPARARHNNCNNFRHGLEGNNLPEHLTYLKKKLDRFRRIVENAVIKLRGEISLSDASFIDAAYKWEKHSRLAARWLTENYDTLAPVDRITFSREMARAVDLRNKAIAELRLNESQADALDAAFNGNIPPATDGKNESEDKQ